jgi:hypothetical protein
MIHLDYNLAYYKLTQARVNQLADDQERYLFVEFSYDDSIDLIKNIYLQKDNKKNKIVFKIEFTNLINGNIYAVKKKFYPEVLYDYVTLILDKRFEDFYYENQYNPIYKDIDLRLVWYFLHNDPTTPISIKWVRDSKYVFSYKRMCSAYVHPVKERADIQVCCKNMGLIKDPVTNNWFCPNHFGKRLHL